jgi:hypothetical protein
MFAMIDTVKLVFLKPFDTKRIVKINTYWYSFLLINILSMLIGLAHIYINIYINNNEYIDTIAYLCLIYTVICMIYLSIRRFISVGYSKNNSITLGIIITLSINLTSSSIYHIIFDDIANYWLYVFFIAFCSSLYLIYIVTFKKNKDIKIVNNEQGEKINVFNKLLICFLIYLLAIYILIMLNWLNSRYSIIFLTVFIAGVYKSL